MKRYLAYLIYFLRHKWFTFLECCKLGIPWLGIIHDWSKFLPGEWFAYARFFHNTDGSLKQIRSESGYYKPTDTGDPAFDFACFLHTKRNKHHWQWWALPNEDGLKLFPMSERYRREMLADWRGASRAQRASSILNWYRENKDKIQLHPETRRWLEANL